MTLYVGALFEQYGSITPPENVFIRAIAMAAL